MWLVRRRLRSTFVATPASPGCRGAGVEVFLAGREPLVFLSPQGLLLDARGPVELGGEVDQVRREGVREFGGGHGAVGGRGPRVRCQSPSVVMAGLCEVAAGAG